MGHKLPDNLTLRDLQVFSKIEQEGKTLDQAAEELGVSRDTVKRTKKRGCYRDLILDAIAERQFTVDEYAKKLIALTEAEKVLNCGGHDQVVSDNPVRMKAIEKLGRIYGDDADKTVNLGLSAQSTSDEELLEEIDSALKEEKNESTCTTTDTRHARDTAQDSEVDENYVGSGTGE